MRNLILSLVLITQLIRAEAQKASNTSATINAYPSWIEQGNIYEVNVRQYTQQGTFKAFEKSLPRLKQMGVQTLWFMPINPISKKGRKGALGSYYSVADYTAVNPEFGTLADWKELVNKAHSMGFKVIIDWVPNHTGPDNVWLKTHPSFYVRDPKTGEAALPDPDWTDTRQLDFTNQEMKDSMTAAMKFWIIKTNIDGFRCDHVVDFQKEFWLQCIPQLRKLKNIFMMAEANEAWVYDAGFDASYPWDAFNVMKQIAAGQQPANAFDKVLENVDRTYPATAIRMYFTSNHDENSWNKADYGTMPGDSHAPFAVLTQTIEKSVPLIYSGQEEPFIEAIHFFYKDVIYFHDFERAAFYRTLLTLRKNNSALAANASFKKLATSNDAAVYAYERENAGNRVLVILNLSNKSLSYSWSTKPSENEWTNVFTGKAETVSDGFALKPWDYKVFEIRKQTKK